MPEAEGLATQESFDKESPSLSEHKLMRSEQYPSMGQHRTSPTFFCDQQSPHRVQSGTNLDLVDCVGSDLLLAMNCLDVGEQGRGPQSSGGPKNDINSVDDHHRLAAPHGFSPSGMGESVGAGACGGDPSGSVPSSPNEDFLPLAALAPPPASRPSWLTAQQQQARVQNEHFPSRVHSLGENGERQRRSRNEEQDSAPEDRRREHSNFGMGTGGGVGGRIHRDENGRDFSQAAVVSGSTLCPGGSGVHAPAFLLERSHSRGPSPGSCRRASGVGSARGTPHLDESWTTVLNAPAGAELMEFLTEQASRALVLWNVEAIPEETLRASCEVYGQLYYLRAEHQRWKRVVFIAYYDIRDAVNAHRGLSRDIAQHLFQDGSRPPPAVHFSVELHAGFSHKEGSLIVHDMPVQATEAEVAGVLQRYGDLQSLSRHPGPHAGHPASFVVEYCNVQDARIAAQEIMVRNHWGHPVTVEPAARSDGERALGRQLHATLNRWTAEATQVKAAEMQVSMYSEQHPPHGGMLSIDDRMRSSSSAVMSGRSSDSDSPPPTKPEEYPRELVFMDSYTPMTSANTTPATTPGSTPPSGAEAYHHLVSNGAQSPGMYLSLTQAHVSSSNGSSRMHAGNAVHLRPRGTHQLYGSASPVCNGSNPSAPPQQHHGHVGGAPGTGGHHHHAPRMPASQHLASTPGLAGNSGGIKPHPLAGSPGQGPAPYLASQGSGYYLEFNPSYHGDCEDDRTSPASMWPTSSSLSPPSASNRTSGGSAGMRGSPPLRGMTGGVVGCNSGPGGPGGLGYKDRARQTSLDEGRLGGAAGSGNSCGARTMRCNSDGAQILVSPGPSCGGSSGDEFSLDLKKVSKGMDKRTTIMIRNIPNKYTQAMLLQEIDASYRGAYDFFYLPIDFKNKCNVGYAFINFMDYRRIVPFYREFNGQRWKNFNSEKVCAISYARIQGKASMISRFQNSSLMEKDGEYRPLIFHSSGAERGRPEPFPASSKVFRGSGTPPGNNGGGIGYSGRDRERSMSSSSSHV